MGRDFARGMSAARGGRWGPVHLSLPTDCLEGETDVANVPPAGAFVSATAALDVAAADAMLERLRRARRPVLLVGPGMMTRKGRESTATLENAAQVPVIGMEPPRGLADSSPGAVPPLLAHA